MVFVLKESKDVFASEAKALGKEHWVNEKDVNNCYCCNDIFSITLRKHHCRVCGNIVCDSCSLKRMSVVKLGILGSRACDHCITANTIKLVGGSSEELVNMVNQKILEEDVQENPEFIKTISELSPENIGRVYIPDYVFYVKEPSLNDPFVLHRRLLVLTSDGHMLLSGPVGSSCRDQTLKLFEANDTVPLIFREFRPVQDIVSIVRSKLSIADASKSKLGKMLSTENIAGTIGRIKHKRFKSSLGVFDSKKMPSPDELEQMEDSIILTYKGSPPRVLNLVVCNELGQINPSATEACFVRFKAQYQRHQSRIDQNIVQLKDSIVLANTPVDWDIESHEMLLKRLWKGLKPDAEYPGRRSEEWKLIGFKGVDPTFEFRSMGLLALHALVYFAEAHSDIATELLSNQSSRDYSLCSAGIDITAALIYLVGVNAADGIDGFNENEVKKTNMFKVMCLTTTVDHQPLFDLFACVFKLVDDVMVSKKLPYTNFSEILRKVDECLEKTASLSPLDFSTFLARAMK